MLGKRNRCVAGGWGANREAGREAVGLWRSWTPFTGGRVTRRRGFEDLRRSRATSHPCRQTPVALPSRCSQNPFPSPHLHCPGPGGVSPGFQSPHLCPDCPHPLLNEVGTGNLIRHKEDLVPLCSRLPSVINSTQSPSGPTTLHCPRCPSIVILLPASYPRTHTPVKVMQVGRRWDTIFSRAAGNDG